MYSQRASSRTNALLSDGIAVKSKLSRLFTVGKRASLMRRSIIRRARQQDSSHRLGADVSQGDLLPGDEVGDRRRPHGGAGDARVVRRDDEPAAAGDPLLRSERDSAALSSSRKTSKSTTSDSRSNGSPAADSAFSRSSPSKNPGCPAIADPRVPSDIESAIRPKRYRFLEASKCVLDRLIYS